MKYFVYLIISKHKNKIISYVGYTSDINKRLKLHNSSKGAKFQEVEVDTNIQEVLQIKVVAMKNEYLLKKNYKKRLLIKKIFNEICMKISILLPLKKIFH